jgi:hypothetical protein
VKWRGRVLQFEFSTFQFRRDGYQGVFFLFSICCFCFCGVEVFLAGAAGMFLIGCVCIGAVAYIGRDSCSFVSLE